MVKSTEAPIINAYIIQKSIVFPTTSLGECSMGAIKCRNNTANNKGMAREYRNREGRRTKAKKGNSQTILPQGLRKKVVE